MRKTLTKTKTGERNGLRILAAVALTGSLAAFGCTTNRTPGYGEPGMSAPAAGAVAPNLTSTPGSANAMGTMPRGTQAMISSSPANGESASLDALAAIKADEAFRGKVLGPAAPGDNSVTPASMQQVTGQYIAPSATANPQLTVNSSISSAPTPAIVSGAAGDTGGVAVITGETAITAGATVAPTTTALSAGGVSANATLNGVQNVGTTGVSSATATPITNGNRADVALVPAGSATLTNAALATNNQVIGTGMANAPAPASNAVATPILSTVGPLGQAAAATATTATTTATRTVTAGTTAAAKTGVRLGVRANTPRLGTAIATPVSPTVTANATLAPATARTRAVRANGGTTAGVRIVNANGTIVVTNQAQSALQNFLSGVGARRNMTVAVTGGRRQ